jgi:hypothetical protein
MTAHELAYCQYLLREIHSLCVENEAMSTLLDNPSFSRKEWRTTSETLCADSVVRSAVDANFGPYFSRLHRALTDAKTLTKLQDSHSQHVTEA